MPKAIDISGHRYGSLTALSFAGTRVGRNGRRVRQWVFACDCGNTHICDVGSVRSGRTSSCGCKMINNLSGMESRGWKGGRRIKRGYVLILDWSHPNCDRYGYVREHVKVMSEIIGRPLVNGETVHHKNGIKTDNSKENLELWCKSQPAGQRVEDLLEWAYGFIEKYGNIE